MEQGRKSDALFILLSGRARVITSDARGREVILAVLEPRSNTMKLGLMKAQLPAALAEADLVFCYGNKLGWDPAEALLPLGERARSFDDLAPLVGAVAQSARPGDHVLVMSNGGFGGVHARILDALAAGRTAAPQP